MDADLEGPDDAAVAGVLLHPHPHFGGDRFHPVIEGCFRALVADGYGACRFDFTSADPETAQSEIGEAIEACRQRWPTAAVVLVGYSFGASMAMRILDDVLAGWFLVAPPQVTIDAATIVDDPRPKRLLVPAADQYSSPAGVAEATAHWRATEVLTIPGDHYLFGTVPQIVGECLEFAGSTGRT